MRTFCNPVFPARQVNLAATPKPITPFGGLVSLIAFFDKIGLAGRISEMIPFAYSSPNSIPPAKTLVAFMISVVAGARRLAHTDWLRADKALHALLGIERFPGTDTVRNFFPTLPSRLHRRVLATALEVVARTLLASTARGL